jgi:hypothetical protein
LLPRGGGAAIAEVDGNLTCANDGAFIRLHWQGKFRGCEFEPLYFELQKATSDKVVDSKGRRIPTVTARAVSGPEHHERTVAIHESEDQLLAIMSKLPGGSMRDWAVALEWQFENGDPAKSKVQKTLNSLLKSRLVVRARGKYELTEKGIKSVGATKVAKSVGNNDGGQDARGGTKRGTIDGRKSIVAGRTARYAN